MGARLGRGMYMIHKGNPLKTLFLFIDFQGPAQTPISFVFLSSCCTACESNPTMSNSANARDHAATFSLRVFGGYS